MDTYSILAPRIDWDSPNLLEAWRRFQQYAELMFTGTLREKPEQDKCNLLLWIGEKGRDVYDTWTLTEDEAKKLKTYYDKDTEYLTPKSNLIYARYLFHEKMQGNSETFEHFVTELKLLVKDFGYPNSDEMVRDCIVFATNSPHVREKLLSQGAELALDKAIDIARSHELAQMQLKEVVGSRDHNSHEAVVKLKLKLTKDQKQNGKIAAKLQDQGSVMQQTRNATDVEAHTLQKMSAQLRGNNA